MMCSLQHPNFCSRMLKMLSDFRGWGKAYPQTDPPRKLHSLHLLKSFCHLLKTLLNILMYHSDNQFY